MELFFGGRKGDNEVTCSESAHGEMTTRIPFSATNMEQECRKRSSSAHAPLSLLGGLEREEVRGHLSE